MRVSRGHEEPVGNDFLGYVPGTGTYDEQFGKGGHGVDHPEILRVDIEDTPHQLVAFLPVETDLDLVIDPLNASDFLRWLHPRLPLLSYQRPYWVAQSM